MSVCDPGGHTLGRFTGWIRGAEETLHVVDYSFQVSSLIERELTQTLGCRIDINSTVIGSLGLWDLLTGVSATLAAGSYTATRRTASNTAEYWFMLISLYHMTVSTWAR